MDVNRTRREVVAFAVALVAVGGIAWGGRPRLALLGANPYPNAQYGAITVQAAATLIPATSLNGREGLLLVNLGAATIYCGFDTSVTTGNGVPVLVNGSLSLALAYNQASGNKKVYCIAASAQVAPADTRWAEAL